MLSMAKLMASAFRKVLAFKVRSDGLHEICRLCDVTAVAEPQSRERGLASTTYLNQTQLITCNFMLGNVDHAANKAFSICNVNALCTPK